jgi:hypothetical protein
MKPRLALAFLFALVVGVVGFSWAESKDRLGPPTDRAVATASAAEEIDTFIQCTREDPCGPGFVCRGGKCVPKN